MIRRDFWYRICATVGTLYLMLCTYLWFMQRTYIYLPTHTALEEAHAELSDAYAEEWYTATKQYLGIRRMVPGASVNYIVFHGNTGEALHRTYMTDVLTHIEVPGNVYVVEYPGYGRKPGVPSKEAFFAAADEAIEAVLRENNVPIVLVGESIGTGVVAYEAARAGSRLRALLFITPFYSFAHVVSKATYFLPIRLLLSEDYENARALASVRVPAFFVLAEDDEVVGLTEGKTLFAAYNGPKQKFIIPNGRHNEVPYEARTDWVREFRWFLKRTE
jgi:pimeloyl-ACP methyl ester carboxylesterase